MPQKSWAVGEEVLAADFNLYVQNQTVPQFATTAERDSQWLAPPVGSMCVTVDTGTLWQRTGGGWWTPWRRLDSATRTTDFGWNGTADSAAIVTVTASGVPSGRKIRIAVSFMGSNSANTTDRALLKIKEGGTVVATCNIVHSGFQASGGSFFASLAPSAGTHTYTLVAAGTNAVNYNLQCSATGPLYMEVSDIGPN